MMGGSIGAVSNLAQGKDVFSNLGQNMLTGAAGAGIMSGVGSAVGSMGAETLSAPVSYGPTNLPEVPPLGSLDTAFSTTPALNSAAITTPLPAQANIIGQPIGTSDVFVPEAGVGVNSAPNMVGGIGTTSPANNFNVAANQVPGQGAVAAQGGANYLNPPTPGQGFVPPGSSSSGLGGLRPVTASGNPVTGGVMGGGSPAAPSSGFLNYASEHPIQTAFGASLLYSGLQKPQGISNAATPRGGNKYDYGYHPAQYDQNGNVISTASYGTPTVTHYAAEGGAIKHYASGSQVASDADNMYGISSGKGPYNDKDIVYGADGPMYKDTTQDAGLVAQMKKISPTMLAKYAKAAKNASKQAAAQKELYAREAAPSDYGDEILAARGGQIKRMADGGMTTPQYNYNAANQTYAQVPQPQTVGNSDSEWLGNFANDAIQGILNNEQKAPPPKYAYDANQQRYTKMAQGGIASLGGDYAAGGKLLQGPGDGMSDSIPAVIQGAKPQRAALAQGEFVVPADVVSHLGNGSTDAGAKRLYAMMDKIRHARTGNKKQGKQINPNHFLPA
jgi:hypothetical protein